MLQKAIEEDPEGPKLERIILARTYEKTIPPRTKEPFSLEFFILGLKFSFSLENYNPGPFFPAAREGLGLKKHSRLKIHSVLKA